jgi:hypothetical protein
MHSAQPTRQLIRRLDRDLFAWLAAAAVCVMCCMAAPALCGHFYTQDDLAEFHLPVRAFYAKCLADGVRFDWMPDVYAGFYLTGEGQGGTYHPLHLLLYRTLPLQTALSLELLLSYPLLLAGMYLLLRQHALRRGAALFGGLLFCFSGFNLLHFAHTNAVAVIAHIPWLLLAIHVLLRTNNGKTRGWAMFAVTGLTGSQLLLGYPQYVWFSLLIEGAYSVWVCSRAADLLWLLPAKLIGAMLGAIQLLPTIDAAAQSTRSAVDPSFSTLGSLHPANLIQLIAPYLFETRVVGQNTHELGLYAGAVPLVLVVWLLSNWKLCGRYKPLAVAALVLAVFALLYAFGDYSLFYQWQTHLPLVDRFRFPSRAIFLFHLAVAVLSAISLAKLLEGNRAASSFNYVAAAVVAALAAALICPLILADFVASGVLIALGPVLIAIAALLTALAARGSRMAQIALVLFAVIDLAAYGVSYSVANKSMEPAEYASLLPSASGESTPRLIGQPILDNATGPRIGNWMLLGGWQRVDGYAGLEPAKQLRYDSLAAMRVSAAQYVLGFHNEEPIDGLVSQNNGLLAIPDPLPRVRLVGEVRQTLDAARDIASIDHVTSALVESPIHLHGGAPGTARLARELPGELDIHTESATEQLLVVADSFHPGWRAAVDGQPVAVVRVNGDFMGCVAPPGEHLIQFRFKPASLQAGAIVTFCGLGLWLCLLIAPRFSRRAAVAEG